MRVLVTGASGFVASHAVKALLASGHRPRLLVRDPARTATVLGELGVGVRAVEIRPGDMLDDAAVALALDGCEAVIHAAAELGVTGPRTDLVEVNVTGTRNVVGGAVALGLDPVIHVSTIGVFVPPMGAVIRTSDPLSSPRTAYGRSKAEAERYVRGLQDDGAPITIVYPGGVLGPCQPRLDTMMEGLASALGRVWPVPPSGVLLVDVRDLAEALARSVVPGLGARRFALGGHYVTWRDLAGLCDALTGVRCRRIVVPGRLMIGLGSLLDAAKRVRSFDYPLTHDAAEFMVTLVPSDDSETLGALGLTLRPVEESVADAVRWLAAAGHLAPHRAGNLAPAGERERVMPRSRLRSAVTPAVQRISASPWFAKVAPAFVPRLDRALHRLTGGRVLLAQCLVPSLLLTTTGHRSGQRRQTPLACVPEPDGSFVVVGSNFGREWNPAWTINLLHDPAAEISYRGRTIHVKARLLDGAERTEVWRELLRVWPVYETYVARAGREPRVFRLTPFS